MESVLNLATVVSSPEIRFDIFSPSPPDYVAGILCLSPENSYSICLRKTVRKCSCCRFCLRSMEYFRVSDLRSQFKYDFKQSASFDDDSYLDESECAFTVLCYLFC
ncbi:hypothetical protein HanRHA438_Chr03g0147861 [Helianthus annuus]|nr:hypothetical protein HanRHA438_Chr03g0147861 [Helianthus annuus]